MGTEQAVSGRLYGIGVGPGDPELMTLKAVRILAAADLVAYPAPEGGESSARFIAAAHIRPGCPELPIPVPMRPGRMPVDVYDEAARLIATRLDAGEDVAVLCEGDPFFYGSFMYLHDRLADRFDCEIVPGVTSLTACAAAAGRPLVRRNGGLRIVPATLDDEALAESLSGAESVAILKVGRHLGRLRAALAAAGRTDDAIYVAHAGRAEERVVPLRGLDLGEAPYFSMILVGERR